MFRSSAASESDGVLVEFVARSYGVRQGHEAEVWIIPCERVTCQCMLVVVSVKVLVRG